MIVDTSVFGAILFGEEETATFYRTLGRTAALSISAGNWLELTTVLARRGRRDLLVQADALRLNFSVAVVSVSPAQAEIGRAAYLAFGKGSGHPAKLNFGDCFAYALARERGEPLLFKGDDFEQTDVAKAL